MKSFTDLKEWIAYRDSREWPRVSVGFVATMGALHEGHAELMRQSRRENDLTVVSIFVNPTQFNHADDLLHYPRTLEADSEILNREKVDYLLLPDQKQLYADDYRYIVTEKHLSKRFCGAHRPGHFDGVLTVVLKLLNLVRPDRAYFGEKDFQQLTLIQGMVNALFVPTQIVAVPTVREKDGLALSSRNLRLSPAERAVAAKFPKILRTEQAADATRAELEVAGFRVDYVEDWQGRRLAAAHLGAVRLIDNVEFESKLRNTHE